MSQNANSLASPLLGLLGIPAQSSALSGVVQLPQDNAQGSDNAVVFGDILGLLGTPASSSILGKPESITDQSQSSADQFAGAFMLTGIGLQQLLAINPQGASPITESAAASTLVANSDSADFASAIGLNAKVDLLKGSAVPWPVSSLQGLPSSPAANGLLLNGTTHLGEGTWEIVKSDISDGLMKLELRSKTDPNEILKVTIPISAIESNQTPAPLATGSPLEPLKPLDRIPLVSDQFSLSKFEQLLSKVQLKEMIVQNQPSTASQVQSLSSPKQLMQITLTGPDTAQSVVMTATVSSDQVSSQIVKPTALIPTMGVASAQIAAQSAPDVDALSAQALTRVSQKPIFGDMLQSMDQGSAESDDTGFTNDDFLKFGTDRNLSATKLSDNKINQPAVRLTLPENLTESLKSGVKSIMLKIEPEHLGPARLNLVMNNNSLSARVIVESVPAKFAVQNSLDQLTDQLARAGIRLDYIDVSLQGGGSHNQFFHRQADWFRSQRHTPKFAGEDLLSPTSSSIAGIPLPSASYVTAGGVNLYA